MKIFFIRHAEAQDRSIDIDDGQRALTQQGIAQLDKDMIYLASILKTYESVVVWSSPLLRAKQTAAILIKNLPIDRLELEEFLATGDFVQFKQKLFNFEGECLVIVGHSPFLNNWISSVVEQHIGVQKGETIEIELLDRSIWRGEIIARFKPNQYSSTLNSIEFDTLFSTKYQEICNQKDLFLLNPDKAKMVHNLRISIRRYHSLLSIFSPLLLKNELKQLNKKLKYLLKELAKLREIDVLIKRANFYFKDKPDSTLLNALKDLRLQEETLLAEVVSGADYNNTLALILIETQNAVDYKKPKEVDLRDYITARIAKWSRKVKKIEQKLNVQNIKEIHRYRIYWKKIRYGLELGIKEQNKSHAAQRWQDNLGCICDADANIKLIKKIFATNQDTMLIKEKDKFIKQEQQRAKSLTKKLLKVKH